MGFPSEGASDADARKILIIDDEQFIVELLEEVICSFTGHEVKTSSQAKLGMEMANKEVFDLIIIDNLMPVILGGDFILQVRNGAGPNKETPFLVVSANPEEAEKKVVNLEKIFFLKKPIKIPEFNKVMADILA